VLALALRDQAAITTRELWGPFLASGSSLWRRRLKNKLGQLSLFIVSGLGIFLSACGGGNSNSQTNSANPIAPSITVTPAAASITTLQADSFTVTVSGGSGTPTGTVTLKSGNWTSSATALSGGTANIQIAAGILAAGSDTVNASYAPDSASLPTYTSASGSGNVTVTKAIPTVVAAPSATSITPGQSLSVAVTVSGGTGAPVATGSVALTSGAFTSAPATLSGGAATIPVPGGSLANGSDTLSVSYTPDSAGSAIYGGASSTAAVTVALVTPTVTVQPSSSSIDTQTALSVKITVSAGTSSPIPTGTVTLTSGAYSSAITALAAGVATVNVPASSLTAGNDTLTASYTPDAAGSSNYSTSSGAAPVTVTKVTPTVTATPASTSIISTQALQLTIAVKVPAGDTTPTGSVNITSGAYTSTSVALSSGSAIVNIPGGSLASGTVTLTANYTPDLASSLIYAAASGVSQAITVTQGVATTTVSINKGVSGPEVTSQLIGMNMAAWFDPTNSFVVPAFQAAGIKSMRWPGGSWSDIYHWQTNTTCSGTPPSLTPGGWADPGATYQNVINDLEIPAGLDAALTANYGTNAACTGPGDPTEASGWVQAWELAGGTISHVTVGNEVYGSWETDLHSKPNDAATYATATASGYYPAIKAVDKNVLVGVVVNPGNQPAWDTTVLSQAKYDFVEYHYYPQAPGAESDTYLTQKAANDLTTQIEAIKSELKAAGNPDIPIYVGEIGSVYSNPGKQSWSITQGLYAGQVLGEMMNEGLSRLTWWIGFGNCNGNSGNLSATLYGWQTFGAYNVFSDGSLDPTCPNAGPAGTMSPTAVAFQLFSNVAVTGEFVLTPSVTGDTTDVRAYAATHSGGTAVVLFNLNETTTQPVTVSLSAEASSPDVKVLTYSKAIYDATQNNVWNPPITTDMGTQTLPLQLNLAPWSMNVVLVQ
jgi:hypothetical protein